MRVALLSSTVEPKDGYGNISLELSQALYVKGIDCTLFLPKSQTGAAAALELPFPVRAILPAYIFRIFERHGPWYFRPLDLREFDLVHDLFGFPYCILATLSAKRSKRPMVMGAQGTHGVRPLAYWPERPLLKWCYKSAQGIAVPSDYTKRRILEETKDDYAIDVIHNGVRFDRFQKSVESASIRNRFPGKKILLTVGGLWGRKGHDLVLRALPEILRQHPATVYAIVGDGNARADLERLADTLGVRNAVEFIGRKSGDALVAWFQACDVYVHTPKIVDSNKFEGFGIVYLEASACGKPIVATDAGGIRDAVPDGETGLIVPADDIGGIAGSVLRLLNDQTLACRLGEHGRAYARKHDWSLIADRYIDWYERSLKNAAR